MNNIVRDVFELASLIVGLSLVGLLITNSGGTSKVITAAASGFNAVLRTATFQGNNGLTGSFDNLANF